MLETAQSVARTGCPVPQEIDGKAERPPAGQTRTEIQAGLTAKDAW